MNKQILIALISALLGTALPGAVKPLAIWNGEFVKGETPNRNGITFAFGGVRFRGQYLEVTTDALGVKLIAQNSGTMGHAIIANIKNISSSPYNRILFCGMISGTDNYSMMLDSDGSLNTEKYSSFSLQGFTTTPSEEVVDFSDSLRMHSYGMCIAFNQGEESFGTFDGVKVTTNNLYLKKNADEIMIGSQSKIASSRDSILAGAHVSYIAVFPVNQNLSLEDFKTWSLNEMTRAETATNVVTAAVAEDAVLKGGDGVGINLLGGTFKVNGATRAYALFVQENSTIEFADAASLTLAGPVYIADGRELTLSLADGAAAASLKAKHFADIGQISAAAGIEVSEATDGEEGCVIHNFTSSVNIPNASVNDVKIMASDENGEIEENFDITSSFSVTDDGAGGVNVEFAPEIPQFDNVTVEEESVKPMQFVGDDIVFGVKTTPGLWYAAVAGGNIDEISASTEPDTEPFMATGYGAKITAPAFVPPLMFYKIIVAPSKAAFGE